jgi:cytosine/adenosine deaminase-related metal-dependent hydrolase
MTSKILYGKYLVTDPDTIIPSGAVYIENDRVVETGTYADITTRRKADVLLGDRDALIIPGLINAHGHGKGISDFQRGALDDTLEVWKFRSYPPVDIFQDTLWQTILLVESGVTTGMHNHTPTKPREALEEFRGLLESYRKSGMGLAFAPAMSYRNPFVYGDNETFIASLPGPVRETAEKIAANSRVFGPEAYFAAVDALASAPVSPLIGIHHGPMAPQWVDEDVMVEIKRRADRAGRMVFTHVQQTPHQRLYAVRTYGKTLIRHMADKGLLGKNVALGHCVWIDTEDIRVMADSGCSVTHHPSCNFRVRNGIAPVAAMLAASIPVGIGMDDKELGDDREYLEEVRVASKLHRVPDYLPGSPCLTSREVFRMATEHGARSIGLENEIGALRPGMRADVTILDYAAMTEPYTFEGHDPVEVLLQRGRKNHVRTVMVAGEVLLKDGKLQKLDREEVLRKLKESIPRDYAEKFEAARRNLEPLRTAIRYRFGEDCKEIEALPKRPFYHVNDRGES